MSSFKVVGRNSMYFDEYWYRYGRIKLELDYDDSEVINNFEKSYNIGKSTANYYAPMSALQIGLIYETQNDFSKAESYFKRCLSMSGFDYERGIHQKAKAGISRISD
jgi:tetratricopeptide (TPR) repeat protein